MHSWMFRMGCRILDGLAVFIVGVLDPKRYPIVLQLVNLGRVQLPEDISSDISGCLAMSPSTSQGLQVSRAMAAM
eukprot:15027274-Alexandrium_andersonii.AAC.1